LLLWVSVLQEEQEEQEQEGKKAQTLALKAKVFNLSCVSLVSSLSFAAYSFLAPSNFFFFFFFFQ
jgi:hypothetical protein